MSVLKEVGRKGLSEGKLTREWEDQKKTQEDEGQIEASVERRRKYEKLGELLSLWDRVKGIRRVLTVPAYHCAHADTAFARRSVEETERSWQGVGVVPEKGYTSYPNANVLDVFKGMVYLLKKRLEEHRQLEWKSVVSWSSDGLRMACLSRLWDTYTVPGKFRQDQGLQPQYQDLHHRALAVHHEPHYDATLPTSRICSAR
ncbi:hypothetical protein I306_06312 [Cryptococcus gattii EJB2]|uniref:Uncharacterized protein n=1 Tax=Cryptococcus gattii EJB2 TaxID=1296103 RepID=A0ABR5BM14_9TREE|nr:hypothetical protein I306_06312 [Cryptococcus gattii EJB2]KJE01095.1 hypothetical protein I311_05264 [Cryptococcus gattii NT-10]